LTEIKFSNFYLKPLSESHIYIYLGNNGKSNGVHIELCVCVQGYLHLKKAVHLLYTYLTYLYEKLYWYKKIRSQLFDKDASFSLWCYFLMQLYLSWVWSRLKHGKFAIMKYAKFNVVTHQKNYSLSCNF